MKRMRKIGCSLLAAVLVLCLAACVKAGSAAAEDVVGVWQREVVFLPYFKAEVDLVLELKEDGTYEKTVMNHNTNEVLDREEGTWSFDGVQLSCVKQQEAATTKYEYDPASNTLKNAGYKYSKIS